MNLDGEDRYVLKMSYILERKHNSLLELPLISKLFPLLHLFTHLSMLFLSLHKLFPPPSSFFVSCFKTILIEVKQIPLCLCQVVGIWVSLGSLSPPLQHLAYHVIKHSTFLYSPVSCKMCWLHSCRWGKSAFSDRK